MKKLLLFAVLLILVPVVASAQYPLLDTHGYSQGWLEEDSSGSVWWSIAGPDIDTSETITTAGFPYLSTFLEFGYNTAAGGDSFAISVHGLASWDDSVYVLVDSVAIGPLVTAELVTPASDDTAWYEVWDTKYAPYYKVVLKGYDGKTDLSTGVKARIRYIKTK
jgi:hypothetical protein